MSKRGISHFEMMPHFVSSVRDISFVQVEDLVRSQALSVGNVPSEWTTSVPVTKLESGSLRHQELVSENAEVGIMFASKPVVQAVTNLFVGPLTNKYAL